VFLAIQEISTIKIAIWVDFNASSAFIVVCELSFIDSAIPTNADPCTLSPFAYDESKVDFSIAFDEFELVSIEEFLERKPLLRIDVVMGEKLTKLFLVHAPDLINCSLLLGGMHSDDLNV
jgi:hypothetical protein